MSTELLTDNRILRLYFDGEKRAIDALFERYHKKLLTSIYFMVRCEATAQDILQETYIKALRNLDSGRYKEDGRFYQWIARIAHNHCIDQIRKKKRRPQKVRDDKGLVLGRLQDNVRNTEQQWVLDEKCYQIRVLIDALPQTQREVVIMRHYMDMSFKEIANITGVSINTALGRMRYALKNLKKMIEDKGLSMY